MRQCNTPQEAIDVVYNNIFHFANGYAVTRDVAECLVKLKLALLLLALDTGHMLDVQYSNFVIRCEAYYCYVPPSIYEILRYMKMRLT